MAWSRRSAPRSAATSTIRAPPCSSASCPWPASRSGVCGRGTMSRRSRVRRPGYGIRRWGCRDRLPVGRPRPPALRGHGPPRPGGVSGHRQRCGARRVAGEVGLRHQPRVLRPRAASSASHAFRSVFTASRYWLRRWSRAAMHSRVSSSTRSCRELHPPRPVSTSINCVPDRSPRRYASVAIRRSSRPRPASSTGSGPWPPSGRDGSRSDGRLANLRRVAATSTARRPCHAASSAFPAALPLVAALAYRLGGQPLGLGELIGVRSEQFGPVARAGPAQCGGGRADPRP